MKFKKAVFVNVATSHLDPGYWNAIDELVEQKVLLQHDDPQLLAELQGCDVLMLGFRVSAGADIFDAAPSLKLINILATAYGTVDVQAASKRGITVCNLGDYSTESVAEFTLPHCCAKCAASRRVCAEFRPKIIQPTVYRPAN